MADFTLMYQHLPETGEVDRTVYLLAQTATGEQTILDILGNDTEEYSAFWDHRYPPNHPTFSEDIGLVLQLRDGVSVHEITEMLASQHGVGVEAQCAA